MRNSAVLTVLIALVPVLGAQESPKPAEVKGTVTFKPTDNQAAIPEPYRLDERRFEYTMTFKTDLPLSGFEIYEVRFPSPVTSAYPENNTVYARYYRPKNVKGPIPCVVVLDILAGNQKLPELVCQHLAQNGIGGLFVQMAYYGPRRPADPSARFLSKNIPQTLMAVRQTVLDLRCAAAWMESRPEIDRDRLGIMGISLGSFMAALAAEMEPRYGRVAVLLGGGGFVDAYWDDPRAAQYRKAYERLGGTKNLIAGFLAPVDPLTYADRLKTRKLLMVAAKNDEIVPARMAESLWNAAGRQQIIWLNSGHYTAIFYLPAGLKNVTELFGK